MFCAFEGKPKILRLYGQGRIVQPDDAAFPDLRARFGERHGVRSVVVVDVTRIADSCGYAVPLMALESERDVLTRAGTRAATTRGSRRTRRRKRREHRRAARAAREPGARAVVAPVAVGGGS